VNRTLLTLARSALLKTKTDRQYIKRDTTRRGVVESDKSPIRAVIMMMRKAMALISDAFMLSYREFWCFYYIQRRLCLDP
jgi:hypothetical protein